MGFLDRAKKLAEQAKGMADEALEKVKEQQAARSSAPAPAGAPSAPGAPAAPAASGAAAAPKVPGVPGTPGGELADRWKSIGLTDPAGVLPAKARAAHGVPTSTKSELVNDAWGVGRRWSAEGRSVGFLYLIDPGNPAQTAAGTGERWSALRGSDAKAVDAGDSAYVNAADGRQGVFVKKGDVGFVVEFGGIDETEAVDLARSAAGELG